MKRIILAVLATLAFVAPATASSDRRVAVAQFGPQAFTISGAEGVDTTITWANFRVRYEVIVDYDYTRHVAQVYCAGHGSATLKLGRRTVQCSGGTQQNWEFQQVRVRYPRSITGSIR